MYFSGKIYPFIRQTLLLRKTYIYEGKYLILNSLKKKFYVLYFFRIHFCAKNKFAFSLINYKNLLQFNFNINPYRNYYKMYSRIN